MAEGRRSIIISVFSTGAGNGKTLTAINLAASLAADGYDVCLVDLDLQFGDVSSYLQLEPQRTITDAQLALERGKEFEIMDYLTKFSKTDLKGNALEFFVLSRPQMIFDAYSVSIPIVENIINSLKWFNYVIVDLSAAFNAMNLAVLDSSTIINYIGVVDYLPSVKNFKIGYDTLLRFEYEESKIRLVENRYNAEKLISGRDVERLLGAEFFHRLPNDFEATAAAIKAGEPLLVAAPNSPLTASYKELAAKYSGKPKAEEKTVVTQSKGFISKIFSKFFG